MSGLEQPEVQAAERRWVVVGIVVALSALVVGAVGGLVRDAVTDPPSHLELVETCFIERNRPVDLVVNDPVAESAERGALKADVDGNTVTVALGGSESDAQRVYEAYVSVAPDEVVATRLERRRKVVLLWSFEPSAEHRELLYLCTLDAQD